MSANLPVHRDDRDGLTPVARLMAFGTPAPAAAQPLTEDELRALQLTADLWNLVAARIVGDGETRSGDLRELAASIHSIQHAIMSQAAARAYPDRFRLLGQRIQP